MNILRPRLKRLAWFALVAMLALMLMPTISRALSHGGLNAGAAHCTPQAMQDLLAGGHAGHAGQSAAPAHASGHFDHCPFCALSLAGLDVPPVPSAAGALPVAGAEPPPLFLHAPRTLFAWRSAQPRGPPLTA